MTEATKDERVGWVLYDGDEYHGFIYASPGDFDLAAHKGYLPVFVKTHINGEPIWPTYRAPLAPSPVSPIERTVS